MSLSQVRFIAGRARTASMIRDGPGQTPKIKRKNLTGKTYLMELPRPTSPHRFLYDFSQPGKVQWYLFAFFTSDSFTKANWVFALGLGAFVGTRPRIPVLAKRHRSVRESILMRRVARVKSQV